MPSLLQKLRSNIDNDRRQLRRSVESLRSPEIRKILATLNRVKSDAKSVSMWYGSPTVTFSLNDLDSFKTGKLPALLDKLLDLGVEFRSSSDWAEGGCRDFNGRIGYDVEVRVCATLAESAKNCQRVKIGEETKVVPKYELCCQ